MRNQPENKLNKYYTDKLTLLELMGVLALLGIALTLLLKYFFAS